MIDLYENILVDWMNFFLIKQCQKKTGMRRLAPHRRRIKTDRGSWDVN